MRGTILGLDRAVAVQRVMAMIVALPSNAEGPKPIAYRLDAYNGGNDPGATYCSNWSWGDRTPTSDCIGLVLWASGIDRLQPGYAGSRGEWLNCASLLDDADGARKYCRPLISQGHNREAVLPGDWLLTPDHIGMIVRPDNNATDGFDHLVVDCSPRHGRDRAVNTGYAWSEGCRVIRPTTLVYPRG